MVFFANSAAAKLWKYVLIASVSAWPSMMRVAFCMSTAERLDGHETVESSHSDIDTESLKHDMKRQTPE